jgi:asparagine synthase (glutamine-hydrolysing)
MCGIWACIQNSNSLIRIKGYSIDSDVPRVRGPDTTNELISDSYNLVFHRLAINDTSHEGDQPFTFTDIDNYTYNILCNGEIYNYKALISQFNIQTKSKSDCEVLCYLFEQYWSSPVIIAKLLDGEFAIVAMRTAPNGDRSVIAMRDPFGVRPLYWSQISDEYGDKTLFFSSMLGGICKIPNASKADHFPPGHYMKANMSEEANIWSCPTSYYDVPPCKSELVEPLENPEMYYTYIRKSLVNAVTKRIESTDRELGFFLSGGLDSSLVVGIATRIYGLKKPRTFSIGMVGSPDLAYAREVSEFLDTEHTEVFFTAAEAIDAIPDVIRALETYDITTIRASIPSYLLAKHINQNTNIRVIMNGDGSDEVACGYLYNYNAPSAQAAHEDALRLLKEIHKFDGLRCDRTIAGNGIEARVPFLDPEFVETYLSIPAELRIPTEDRMEKLMLRNAFDSAYTENNIEILPKSVLFRRKEAFSNGVSAKDTKETMIDAIQTWAKTYIGYQSENAESIAYKRLFESQFPKHTHVLPHYWMPKWSGETNDPSATTLNIYKKLNK